MVGEIKIPRLRMFAGPNGSGKSTLKSVIANDLLGIFNESINSPNLKNSVLQNVQTSV
jgi:predicted ABC-type ATPase